MSGATIVLPFRGELVSTLTVVLGSVNRLLQILAWRTMYQEHACRTAYFSLTDQASIEAYPIRRSNTDAENGWLVVYRNATRADPVFDLTTRTDAGAGKYLLKAFAFVASLTVFTSLWRWFTAGFFSRAFRSRGLAASLLRVASQLGGVLRLHGVRTPLAL